MIKQELTELIQKFVGTGLDFSVTIPPEGNGDLATNAAFLIAKKDGSNPLDKAQDLADKIKKEKLFQECFEKCEVISPGFVNFYFKQDFLKSELESMCENPVEYFDPVCANGETVIVEYSQPNIAKPMHAGHLRTTILGDALANIYDTCGYRVIRWNYIGDWGTQFGKLIAAYKKWDNKSDVEKDPIQTLVGLYVRFNQEAKNNPDLDNEGRAEFKKLEDGDKENIELWNWFKAESLKEFEKMYDLLSIKFDEWKGESFFEKDMKTLVTELLERRIAEKGEGNAVIINLDKFNLPPALIQKSDGASLYLTRDIASLRYRLENYEAKEILYVVGNEQSLHFEQLKAVSLILGLPDVVEHVKYGLVLGENKKKLATREGTAITAKELIDRAMDLAEKIIKEKSRFINEEDIKDTAESIAIGAIKHEMLKDQRVTNIVFNWDRMLDFSGNSGPYLQYTYARINSILEKVSNVATDSSIIKEGVKNLGEESELSLIKSLLNYVDIVQNSRQTNSPHFLVAYLSDLANIINKFYESVRIMEDEDKGRQAARLKMIEVAKVVLGSGLGLLGIKSLKHI